MVRRPGDSRESVHRRIARQTRGGESETDRPFDRSSDSAAARHPVGGTTRRRIGPNVGGPFDGPTVRRRRPGAHRPTVMTGHGQMSTSSGTPWTARDAGRGRQGSGRARRARAVAGTGARVTRTSASRRRRSASVIRAGRSGSSTSVRAARSSARSAVAPAERGGRRGSGTGTRTDSEAGRRSIPRPWRRGGAPTVPRAPWIPQSPGWATAVLPDRRWGIPLDA
jgi:hypothetical protein